MARFVLLYFKDDKRADEYVGVSLFTGARVVGIYQDPRHEPCKCTDFGPTSNMSRQGDLHKKYGWFVHKKCRRISKDHRKTYGTKLFQLFGTNLLPRKQTPNILRNPEWWDKFITDRRKPRYIDRDLGPKYE